MSLGFVSLIIFRPCSPLVAPINVIPAFFTVLFIKSCIAISSSISTHKFSPSKEDISSFSSSSDSSQILGIKMENTDPTPFSLDTVTPPPINSANLLLIGRPRPVPPCVAEVDLSACSYSSKTFATPSSLMPSPSSVTLNSIISTSSFMKAVTSKVTKPLLVNLKALLKKFVTHCLSFVSS